MGCGASRGHERDGADPNDETQAKYQDRESLQCAQRRASMKTDYEEVMEDDRRSQAHLAEEPSPIAASMKHSYRKMKARWEHGINEDPGQYQDEVDKCVPYFREKDRLRIQRWVNDTILPAEKDAAERRAKAAAAAAANNMDMPVAGNASIESEGLGANYSFGGPVLHSREVSKDAGGLTNSNKEGEGSSLPPNGRTRSGSHNNGAVGSPLVPGLTPSSQHSSPHNHFHLQSPTGAAPYHHHQHHHVLSPAQAEPKSMDFVISVDEDDHRPHQNGNYLNQSKADMFGSQSLTVLQSPMGVSVTGGWRGMELSTTGMEESTESPTPTGAKQRNVFRKMNNFSFTEQAANLYGPNPPSLSTPNGSIKSGPLGDSNSSGVQGSKVIPSPTNAGSYNSNHNSQQQLPPSGAQQRLRTSNSGGSGQDSQVSGVSTNGVSNQMNESQQQSGVTSRAASGDGFTPDISITKVSEVNSKMENTTVVFNHQDHNRGSTTEHSSTIIDGDEHVPERSQSDVDSAGKTTNAVVQQQHSLAVTDKSSCSASIPGDRSTQPPQEVVLVAS